MDHDKEAGAQLSLAGLNLVDHESPLVKYETLQYLTLADGGRVRAVCREYGSFILGHKWDDTHTKVTAEDVGSWRRSFPRAEAALLSSGVLPTSKHALLIGVKKLKIENCELDPGIDALVETLHGLRELTVSGCAGSNGKPARLTDDALVHLHELQHL
jgi:hypothetical protein